MSDITGQMLNNRYRIDAYLGRGGMAEVYRAYDIRRSYPVAIKLMHPDLAEDRELVYRFRQEADNLAALAHENIVRFYSLEQDRGLAFLVMDYVAGVTLRTLLAQTDGPLPMGQVAHIFPQICQALHFAHEEGYVHRDVKPGNVMIRPDGQVLVADFGIAKAIDAATVTTYMPGTPAYMSPEQCRSEPTDRRSDVYALGIVLFEMVAGRRPFVGSTESTTGSTREKVWWEQINAAPPTVETFNPQVPSMLGGIIQKALAKEPEKRFSTAQAFQESFEIATDEIAKEAPVIILDPATEQPGFPLSPPPVYIPQPTPSPVSQAKPWAQKPRWQSTPVLMAGAGGAALMLVLLALAGLMFFRGKDDSLPPVNTTNQTPKAAAVATTVDLEANCPTGGAATLVRSTNILNGPGPEFGAFATLSQGTPVEVTGQNEKGTWWRVLHPAGPNGQGWIDRDFLEAGEELCPRVFYVTMATDTPEPTATPTQTPTPKTKVNDTLQLVTTPATPTEEPRFGRITFAKGATAEREPVNPSNTFEAGITEVYAVFEYSGMSTDDRWRRVISVDGTEVLRNEITWPGDRHGKFDYLLNADDVPMTPGDWTLEFYVNNKLLTKGNFTIKPKVALPPAPPTATPAPAATCPDPRSAITYPRNGDSISGIVGFRGTADLPNLQYYKIEYKPANEPSYRHLVQENYKWVKNDEVLFTFVTSTVPRGTYDFRLIVVAMDGNYPPPCEVRVEVR